MYNFDLRTRIDENCLNEPRNAETNQNIKDIAANCIADCHVSLTIPNNCNSRESIRNTDASSNKSETHDCVRNTKGEANDSNHPYHDI